MVTLTAMVARTAAVCASLQTRADYAARRGPSRFGEPIDLVLGRPKSCQDCSRMHSRLWRPARRLAGNAHNRGLTG